VKSSTAEDSIMNKESSTDHQSILPTIFKSAYESSLANIATDPIYNLFGKNEVSLLCNVVLRLPDILQFFLQNFLQIFSADTNLCSAADRELLFTRFHQTRLSKKFTHGYMLLLGTLTVSTQGICHFVNVLMMELIANVLKEQVRIGLQNSAKEHDKISHSDQSILFYICGFIARSLRKRYHRVKSMCVLKKQCIDGLVLKTANSTFAGRFNNWVSKNDRGGLLIPCDEFFLLIREFETVIRRIVNLDSLSANSLKCDQLKEFIMESFMVKHYGAKLFSEAEDDTQVSVLEDILSLFLTVRGYAITRTERNKLAKGKQPQKKSAGLRKTLQDLNPKRPSD
jgi:hypothetical protein